MAAPTRRRCESQPPHEPPAWHHVERRRRPDSQQDPMRVSGIPETGVLKPTRLSIRERRRKGPRKRKHVHLDRATDTTAAASSITDSPVRLRETPSWESNDSNPLAAPPIRQSATSSDALPNSNGRQPTRTALPELLQVPPPRLAAEDSRQRATVLRTSGEDPLSRDETNENSRLRPAKNPPTTMRIRRSRAPSGRFGNA